ncbi:N-acetyltransferase [Hyphomicrobium sp.]|jgi:hypothetical protein|uniref:N-acetyltransferase n=1 Tax=Hyphomicrobium sp. TaxID=82 RepID=UPI002BD47A31|nr:N-acetyltransferase [Hyphomicrobium sp.]HVZ04655.1 N-acetyltransferase [Hyphomicrobium sp.]
MNAATRYERLTTLRSDSSFNVAASEAAIDALFKAQPVIKILTESDHTFFVRRHLTSSDESLIIYQVFVDETSANGGENDVGHCHLCRPVNGIVTIVDAAVNEEHQRKGIATAVYDCIAKDMGQAGVLLWPVSPSRMTEPEFKVWWRRSPALVFYYPHRERLGLEPRREFEQLFNEEFSRKGFRNAPAGALGTGRFLKKFSTISQWLGLKFTPTRDD